MSQLVDNLIAFRVLNMLVVPFEKTKAYKMGLIDKEGNPLKKVKDMTFTEKDAYTMLHRMVFRIKRIMAKVPGLGSQLGSLATAYFLVKECLEQDRSTTNLEQDYYDLLTKLRKEDIILCEEFLLVEEFLRDDAPVNVTGEKVSTDTPVVKKNFAKFKVADKTFKKFTKGKKKFTRFSEYFEQSEKLVVEYANTYPDSAIILINESTGETKGVRFNRNESVW